MCLHGLYQADQVVLATTGWWAAGATARDMLQVHQAKGAGYAISQPAELETALQVALKTGADIMLCSLQ